MVDTLSSVYFSKPTTYSPWEHAPRTTVNPVIDEAARSLLIILNQDSDLTTRNAAWQKMIDTIDDYYYDKNLRKDFFQDTQAYFKKFFTALATDRSLDIENYDDVIAFLKTLPKTEAVYCLYLYGQTFFDTQSFNDYHPLPRELFASKAGECDDFALFYQAILQELDIPCQIIDIRFDWGKLFAASANPNGTTNHIFVKIDLPDSGKGFFLDNMQMKPYDQNAHIQRAIVEVYPDIADSYRVVDGAKWYVYREEDEDPDACYNHRVIQSAYTRIRPIHEAQARTLLSRLENPPAFTDIFEPDPILEDVFYFKPKSMKFLDDNYPLNAALKAIQSKYYFSLNHL
jgi:hypothetical protein